MQADRPAPARAPASLVERVTAVLSLVSTVALIGVGQYAVGNGKTLFTWPGLGPLDDKYREIFTVPNALAFATPLFLLGAALFAAAALGIVRHEAPAWKEPGVRRPPLWCLVPLVVSAGALLWIIAALFLNHLHPTFRFIFVSAVGLMVLVLLVYDLREGRLRLRRPGLVHVIEFVAVLAVMGTFVGINVYDLTNWRYAPIGDDGGFFIMARRIITDDQLNWFSQTYGIFGVPVLGSAWNAINMLIFGSDIFGWKMGSVMSVAVTLPALYWLLRELFSGRVAVFGTVFLAASHYLFAYSHTGYPNLFSLFPTVAALACFVAGMKRGSPALLVLCGVFAALGFYTFYSSRATVFIIGIALLTTWDRRLILQTAAWIAPAFSLTVLPLFAVDRWDVVSGMMRRSYRASDEPAAQHMAYNLVRSIFGFSFNPYHHIYTAGGLQDGVSVTLSYAGLGLSLGGIMRFPYRLLVIWFLVAIVVAGVLSEYSEVSISRMHYALPPMAAFAALALDAIVTAVGDLYRRPWFSRLVTVAALAMVAPTVFILNGRQFFIYSAHNTPTNTITLIYRELLDSTCKDAPERSIVIVPEPDPSLDGSFRFYNLQDKRPVQLRLDDESQVYTGFDGGGGVGCIIVADARDPAAQPVLARLERERGEAVPIVTDLTGETQAAVLYPAPRKRIDTATLAGSWRTDFSQGGSLDRMVRAQVKDFQPPVTDPGVAPVADIGLAGPEPVVVATVGDSWRGYPVRFLMRHGVVNDVLAGVPIVVTYDPISGAARVFDRRSGDQTYTFSLTGFLKDGNALLYDTDTESWWQQLSGRALIGVLTGRQLAPVQATVVSAARFREMADRGGTATSMMTPPSADVPYNLTLYVHYDVPKGKPLFALGPHDERLRALQRVEIIEVSGARVALPFPEGGDVKDSVYTVEVGGRRVLLLFDASTVSELDNRTLFDARHIGRFSAFEASGGAFTPVRDGTGVFSDETGTVWDMLGNAVDGTGAGARLTPVTHYTSFWFSASGNYPALELSP